MLSVALALVGLFLVERALYHTIREHATRDEARRVDALIVFGAAQYNGVPSPVFKARLDHTVHLEEKGLAPVVITTGGSGGDLQFTEADVGRDYLIQQGVAAERILTEARGETTLQSVVTVAWLLKDRGARSCLAVSDGFHLYRIKLMFAAHGITAYGSPVPNSPIESEPYLRTLHSLRETAVTTLWYLGVCR